MFLDDERRSGASIFYTHNDIYTNLEWVVENYEEFIEYIKDNGIPKRISFDHDLGVEHYKYSNAEMILYREFEEKTGYHCLS